MDNPREIQSTRSDGFRTAVFVEGGLAVLAVVLAWIFGVQLRDQLPDIGWPLARAVGIGALATLPMLIMFLCLVHSPRPEWRQLRSQVEWLLQELFPTHNLAQFALVAALAGVGEELLFRGVLQKLLVGWTSPPVGLALAALLFGLAHALSRLYFLLATLIGVYLGWLTWQFNDLAAPMITHALYDFLALAYLSARRRGPDPRNEDQTSDEGEHTAEISEPDADIE